MNPSPRVHLRPVRPTASLTTSCGGRAAAPRRHPTSACTVSHESCTARCRAPVCRRGGRRRHDSSRGPPAVGVAATAGRSRRESTRRASGGAASSALPPDHDPRSTPAPDSAQPGCAGRPPRTTSAASRSRCSAPGCEGMLPPSRVGGLLAVEDVGPHTWHVGCCSISAWPLRIRGGSRRHGSVAPPLNSGCRTRLVHCGEEHRHTPPDPSRDRVARRAGGVDHGPHVAAIPRASAGSTRQPGPTAAPRLRRGRPARTTEPSEHGEERRLGSAHVADVAEPVVDQEHIGRTRPERAIGDESPCALGVLDWREVGHCRSGEDGPC